jgi:hypothetical protein
MSGLLISGDTAQTRVREVVGIPCQSCVFAWQLEIIEAP